MGIAFLEVVQAVEEGIFQLDYERLPHPEASDRPSVLRRQHD